MTTHLSSQEFVNALELGLAPSRQAHLDGCVSCQTQVAELREVMEHAASGASVPEPSPLFWDHFQARVLAAVATGDTPPTRQAWWQSWASARTWLTASATVIAVIAAVALYVGRPPVPAPDVLTDDAGLADNAEATFLVPNGDEWDFVAGIIGALEGDDIREVLTPSHDAVDAAFEGLNPDERARFMQLLKAELARGTE
jgi:hypothetical protein